MKKIFILALSLLVAFIALLPSCKKEYSCENCIGNKPPIARAGTDQIINLPLDSTSLDGSSSTDPDGTISSFSWRKITGPVSVNIVSLSTASTKINNLTAGIYQFELTVTDNGGLSGKDTMQVSVINPSQPNRPPIANAGPDQTIILPVISANLDGSGSTDPDNNITNYLWTRISGPSSLNIGNANVFQTAVTNLSQGTYLFELKVTDAGALFSTDTMQVIVNAAIPVPPICDPSVRLVINAQVIPVTTIPGGSYSATVGNKMYYQVVECGTHCDDTTASRTYFNIYDINSQTWSVSSDHLTKTRGMSTVCAGANKIFIAGGYNSDDATYRRAVSDVDIYNIATNSWSVTNLDGGKYGMAAAVLNNKVFFAGGYYEFDQNNYYVSNKVEIYDFGTTTWSTQILSEGRTSLSATVAGDKIYFAGGINPLYAVVNTVDVYDNSTNSWSFSNLQEPKADASPVVAGNKIYWAGAVIENRREATGYSFVQTQHVEIKDLSTGNSVINCLFQANYVVGAQKNNQIVFLGAGGYYSVKNKFDIFDITTNTWSIGLLPLDFISYALISVNNTLYIPNADINGLGSNQIWKLEY